MSYINKQSTNEINRLIATLKKIDVVTNPDHWTIGDPLPDNQPDNINIHIKNFITAFLSCSEGGDKYGDSIIAIANALDRDDARKFFAKYAEIATKIESAKQYLRENFRPESGTTAEFAEQATRNLLRRGNELIDQYAATVATHGDMTPLLKKLDDIQAEAMLFTSTFRALRQELGPRPLDLRELKFADFIVSSGEMLKEQTSTVEAMKQIYQKNYGDRSQYSKEFSDALLRSFENALNNPGTRFYLLKHQNDIAAFCRFDHEYRNGVLKATYFGSFNTNPTYWRGRVGETMVEQALNEEKELGVPIFADCNPRSPITKKYIEFGFVATRAYEHNGTPSLSIELPPKTATPFTSKQLSNKDIATMADKAGVGREQSDILVRSYPHDTEPDLSPLRNEYALTRFFDEGNRTICVFEKMPRGAITSESLEQAA